MAGLDTSLAGATTDPADAGQDLDRLVRPSHWRNPPPAPLYDLVVIGAGTAGLVTAVGAAGLGARVALVERDRLGGDCLNAGCVPSKSILRAARAAGELRRAGNLGIHSGAIEVDFPAVMHRMRQRRITIAANDSAGRMASLGIDLFLGEGVFSDARALTVGDLTLRFRRAVIATGSRPSIPPIEGLFDTPYLTNETIFELTALPARMLVIGAGPVGCELSQAFARLGSEVTLFDQSPRVLPQDDPDASAIVDRALGHDGIRLHLGSRITRVSRRGSAVVVRFSRSADLPDEEIAGDRLLIATGRAPNLTGLHLDRAGIRTGRRGLVVDDRLRTSNARVYAAGDVCSPLQLTHAADAMARIVIQNALFLGRRKASSLTIPWCTYTDPEVAHVGWTTGQTPDAGLQTITVPFSEVDRAIVDDETDGFLKIRHRRGRIVGCTVVSSRAGDLIGHAGALVSRGASLSELASTVFPYPTQSESLRKAGDAYRRTLLTPGVRWLFKRYLELMRW
jgi:pyruvate/2-oxoglutarate dehydrogenase complex dihydrolipoamide dehydrogenase (E3) component